MTTNRITRLAMAVAGTMLAHQVASKAVREAVFLSGPGIAWLPTMVMATALAVVIAVPAYSRLMASWGPRRLVPFGFALSAAAHLIEWRLPPHSNWVAVLIYLHVAGIGALLLSGFWLLLSEVFDTRAAKDSFGPIAAGGTIGGLAGGGAVLVAPIESSLLVLAALHALCAVGIWSIGRRAPQSTLADRAAPATRLFEWEALRRTPHVGTVALIVLLSTAAAGIVDFLFKQGVTDWFNQGVTDREATRAEMQPFFALFYMGVGLLTFAAQTGAGAVVRRFGIGRTLASLPAGLGVTGAIAMLLPSLISIGLTRATESVLRGSWFRSGYELLFVPMAPDEKRRIKTFLDVTCDRAGDAVGAAVVQGLVLAAWLAPAFAAFQYSVLLAVTLAITAISLWISRRVDKLYLGVIADRLADQAEPESVAVQSETGWTLLDFPAELRSSARAAVSRVEIASPATTAPMDPRVKTIADLRSGDRAKAEAALHRFTRPERAEVAQAIQLLAWDDLAPLVRLTLERVAGSHVGLLEDALLDRETDFAIRRRIPRILAAVTSERALAALVAGLDDPRFEVRYQCARAITRLMSHAPALSINPDRIMAAIEREVSVPLQVWEGHRLLDAGDPGEDPDWLDPQHGTSRKNLEHVFALLGLVLPKEPLHAAFRGIQSVDPELRALTLEYFESVLPMPIVVRLWSLPDFADFKSSSGGAR